MTHRQKLQKCLSALKDIDAALDMIEIFDPYGDMAQNFETPERKRITDEVRDTIRTLERVKK